MLELKKKLHDLLILRITQEDKKRKTFPLAQIVGRTGMKWDTEVPVDRGWIDIHVPMQKGIKQPYVIEVETGYDFNCSGISQKFERFRKALTKPRSYYDREKAYLVLAEKIKPKLCVVIPPDFAEFIPLFKAKEISVFLWEGTVEWKCPTCEEITLGSGPWKPRICSSKLCNKKQRQFRLVGLADFRIKQTE